MSLGPRELIWVLIATLAVYVVFQLLRATSARKTPPALAEVDDAPAAAASADGGDDSAASQDIVEEALPVAQRDEVRERAERVGLELEVQRLRRDIDQLRVEQEAQRRDSQRLADEFGRIQEATATLQAGQRISPQYGEAVMLARRGMESDAIAERCGISVAEAALVRSLSQGGDDGGGEHGA